MARRRRSSKCPEPFNTLIDLAGAAAMDYLINTRREKERNKRGNKINRYAASGMAVGTGMVKNTEDILRLGGMLGAMGAFDDDDDSCYSGSVFSPGSIRYRPIDNKYAWRLNCEDGSAYGLSPDDFETREEYNEALRRERGDAPSSKDVPAEGDSVAPPKVEDNCEPISVAAENERNIYADDDLHIYLYCKVELAECAVSCYYLTEDETIKKGMRVRVPSPSTGEETVGTVLSVERHMLFSVPTLVENTPTILGVTE